MSIPVSMREYLYGKYGSIYGVNFEDIKEPLVTFSTFNHFFTREVLPREVDPSVNKLCSPADSKILSFEEVREDSVLMIKG